MLFPIPFVKQKTDYNCGPTVLHMIALYFDQDIPVEKIETVSGFFDDYMQQTIQLAIGAKELGFHCEFYSTAIQFNETNMQHDFYKKLNNMSSEDVNQYFARATKMGIPLHEKHLELDQLLSFVTKDSAVLILLNWSIIRDAPTSFIGHFVPIVGYDDEYVYIHNQGKINPTQNLKLPRETFESARLSSGTDEDVLVVYRN